MKYIKEKGMTYISFPHFGNSLIAAISGREGGVSQGDFASLNMKFLEGENPQAVIENRRRFLSLFSISEKDIVACEQVHGNHVAVVDEKEKGKGALTKETAIPRCDGLVTNVSAVPLTMYFADCTPLLFADVKKHVVGIAHGGWRGTVGGIGAVMVETMERRYGCRTEDIYVAIGPAIGFDDFEVGEEVINAFRRLFTAEEIAPLVREKEGGKFLFDLPRANRLILEKNGIDSHHIEDCGISTYSHTDLFYSYRKEKGKTGRHMAVMMLKD